jgi:hypothetical protein
MTLPSIKLLRDALVEPHSLTSLTPAQWDLLIRQARNASMLARMASDCKTLGILERIPEQPRRHLDSAAVLATRQHRELWWEVQLIEEALASSGIAFVLLKGAAYTLGGLLAARGRMMTDVDILVPHKALPEVESALMMHGWVSDAKSDYDQRYYRTWMHELPPMRHFHRGTAIDVHHAIVPISSRSHPSSDALLSSALTIPGLVNVKSLAPLDMVLHSASHLFHEGELDQGFRGVVDLDSLLREFGEMEGFWADIVPRAIELELVRPLFYALRYTSMMLGTPIPTAVMTEANQAPGVPKSQLFLTLMDALFLRALRPTHPSTSDAWTPLARWLLYVRGHWMRMPPWLLIPHLARKTWLTWFPEKEG